MSKILKVFFISNLGGASAATITGNENELDITSSFSGLQRFNESCASLGNAAMCEGACKTQFVDCNNQCNDQACINGCNRNGFMCLDACPCHADCPLGCVDCDNWSCEGGEPPVFQNTTILVVYNYNRLTPVLFDTAGKMSNADFMFEDGTGCYYSCSAVLKGRMLIFGGHQHGWSEYITQISEVEDCRLHRLGDLPMEFEFGACNTFGSGATENVHLCFGREFQQGCHTFDGKQVEVGPSANGTHWETSLGNFEDKPFAVGGYGEGFQPRSKSVEILENGEWRSLGDFPFVENYICRYSVVNFNGDLILFGGWENNYLNLAVKYDGSWTGIGSLNWVRAGHRSVVSGNSIIHIGGYWERKLERWTFNGLGFDQEDLRDPITDYYNYGEAFLVGEDICN